MTSLRNTESGVEGAAASVAAAVALVEVIGAAEDEAETAADAHCFEVFVDALPTGMNSAGSLTVVSMSLACIGGMTLYVWKGNEEVAAGSPTAAVTAAATDPAGDIHDVAIFVDTRRGDMTSPLTILPRSRCFSWLTRAALRGGVTIGEVEIVVAAGSVTPAPASAPTLGSTFFCCGDPNAGEHDRMLSIRIQTRDNGSGGDMLVDPMLN